uniref:Uncharacterized protein n=1 Tax=Arundo donax TaxID=35708 RepID=A0A0A9EAS2_ARUDO
MCLCLAPVPAQPSSRTASQPEQVCPLCSTLQS